jgi:RimJ/RimL family protein N-acetyltransferase
MLQGEKVVLRAVEPEDLDVLYEQDSEFELTQLADDEPWFPKTRSAWREEFEEYLKKPEEMAIFVIEADGAVIGSCSLRDFDYTARRCELGIQIGDRDYWGKGYGRDAIRLLARYAFETLGMNRIQLSVRADNERAVRAYEAAGFKREGVLRQWTWHSGAFRDWVQMGLLTSDLQDHG